MNTVLKAVKGSETDKMTVYLPDCDIYLLALNMPPRHQGCGIKDLRLIESLASYIESMMPQRPEPPKMNPPQDGKKDTPEETKAKTQVILEYNQALKQAMEKPIVLELNSTQKSLLKQKVLECTVFPSDKDSRQLILGAADKLGVQFN